MKYIAYYRVSTQKQGIDGYGIGAQREAVSRYLNSVGGEVAHSYEEIESGGNCNRPQLLAALKHALTIHASIIVGKLDRLSRDLYFLLTLQRSGVKFVFCDMPQADSLTINLMAMMAEHERKLCSVRTKAGLAIARSRGKTLGSPVPGRGWKVAAKVIQARKNTFNESALKSIKEIQSTGIESLNRIADCMNKRGEKTAMGKTWNAQAVKRVLAARALFAENSVQTVG
jgi:DNA invertase Pin-like site-specific DNA recombinase